MNRDELDMMRQIVEKSVEDTDDFIKMFFGKETENDKNGDDR